MSLRSIAVLAVLAAASRSSFANVLVVGPGHWSTVQEAVDAAHEGDIVLVYAQVQTNVVVSKGVTIAADVPGQILWSGSLHIQDVPAGSAVVVTGFELGFTSPLLVSNCFGRVRIDDCLLLPTSVPFQGAHSGAICTSNRDVAFLHSNVFGGSGVNSPPGAVALSATGSTLTIQDATVQGGDGRDGAFDLSHHISIPGGAGAHAIALSGGGLVLQCAGAHGGSGGDGFVGNCSGYPASAGGNGGDGVMLGAGALARAVDGTFAGGTGGLGGVNACTQAPDGANGVAVDAAGGTWSEIAGPDRALGAPRIVREGDPLVLTFSGAPSEHVFLAISSATVRRDAPALDGVWLLGTPMRRIDCGTLDAQGAGALTLTTPDLPDGATNDLLYLQPVMIDGAGNVRLGCARVVARLDAAY